MYSQVEGSWSGGTQAMFAHSNCTALVVAVVGVVFFAWPFDIGPSPPTLDVFRAAKNATASFLRPLPALENLDRTFGGALLPEYLNQDKYLKHLVHFGNSLPFSSVEIVWVTKDSGKS
jgi:hypothetical protein